MPTQNRLPERA